MKKIIILLFVLAAAVTAAYVTVECYAGTLFGSGDTAGNGNATTRTIELGDFDKIETAACNVVYTCGAAVPATFTCPADIADRYAIVNDGGTLKIEYKGKRGNNRTPRHLPTITVSSPALRDVEASLSSAVTIENMADYVDEFDAELSTAATLHAPAIRCRALDVEVSTAATASVDSVSANSVSLESSTAATVSIGCCNASVLKAESTTGATIDISGGSATGRVNLEAYTGATVKCRMSAPAGNAEASTGATVIADTANLSVATFTGGTVRNYR